MSTGEDPGAPGMPPDKHIIKYVGCWRYGHRHGKGTATFSDGSTYTGEWTNDQPNGYAPFPLPNKKRRPPNKKTNKKRRAPGMPITTSLMPHGWGCYTTPFTCEAYTGEWSSGKRCGYGEQVYADGTTYKGMWDADVYHGYGVCVYQNAGGYRGYWKNGWYSGGWENGVPNGSGVQIYPDGSIYTGHFEDGMRSGTGIFVDLKGATWGGDWRNDKKHGKVEMRTKTGDEFICEYVDDKRHGNATLELNSRKGQIIHQRYVDDVRITDDEQVILNILAGFFVLLAVLCISLNPLVIVPN